MKEFVTEKIIFDKMTAMRTWRQFFPNKDFGYVPKPDQTAAIPLPHQLETWICINLSEIQ